MKQFSCFFWCPDGRAALKVEHWAKLPLHKLKNTLITQRLPALLLLLLLEDTTTKCVFIVVLNSHRCNVCASLLVHVINMNTYKREVVKHTLT